LSSIGTVRDWLAASRSICVLTGAGISTESGIPTFRGPGGLWRTFRAEDLANVTAFHRNPKLVWEWYEDRRGAMAAAQPNPGHLALAELERRTPEFTIVTQNIDGLHQRGGSRSVLEVHGSIWVVRCTNCAYKDRDERVPLPELPPKCPRCSSLLRPDIVWFGEMLPPDVWDNAEQAVLSAGILLVIGTSAVVYPAASLAPLAKSAGARVVEINPDETPLSSEVDAVLRGPSGVILPQLIS
jgi:NAD-dependent deacetylase